jgi:hypothetical protein
MTDRSPVDEQVFAYNARDLERFVACYAEDVVIENGAGEVLMRGADGMREGYGPYFAENPELHAEIVHRIELGDYVVDEERITGAGPEPVHAVAIYHLAEGRIDHVRLIGSSRDAA